MGRSSPDRRRRRTPRRQARRRSSPDPRRACFRDGALYLSYIHSEPHSVSLETSTHLVFATPASNVLVVRERREARFDHFVFGLSLVFAAGGSVLVADGLAHPERSGDDRMLEIGFGALALVPGLTGLVLQVSALLMPRRDRVLYESQTRKGEPN